jgi:hypothetical protein
VSPRIPTAATNKTRIVKKVVPTDSFFNFFSPPSPPSMEALEAGDIDEDELEALDERLELDYQVGEDIKERVSRSRYFPFPHGQHPTDALYTSSLSARPLTSSPARQVFSV